MASQVLIDFKSIGDQIAAAVKSSVEEINRKPIADKANAKALWHIFESRNAEYKSVEYEASDPDLELLVIGTGSAYSAEVVQTVPGSPGNYLTFIVSVEVGSAEETVRKLFDTTTAMLNAQKAKCIYYDDGKKWVDVEGAGGYYAAEK